MIEDCIHHFLRFVQDLKQLQVGLIDSTFPHLSGFEPINQALPERPMHQNDGNAAGLAGLHQGQYLRVFFVCFVVVGLFFVGCGVFVVFVFVCFVLVVVVGVFLVLVGCLLL